MDDVQKTTMSKRCSKETYDFEVDMSRHVFRSWKGQSYVFKRQAYFFIFYVFLCV